MIKYTSKGIYCVPGRFYIDPWKPVSYAVITHGHADHARWGMSKYLCHHYTVPILKSRIGFDIKVEGLSYGEVKRVNGVQISLHPAGHIIGSAQVRLEYKGQIAVISGDYKLSDDGLSTSFEPIRCHQFVTESTFGLPIYQWESIDKQNEALQQWVYNNRSDGKTSIVVGYSLGKAQRILKALENISPIYVHYSIDKLNKAYESAGVQLPTYQCIDLKADLKSIKGDVLIVPPSLVDSQVIKKVPEAVHAICSGWMAVRGARRWRSADAGFAISDHADWPELLQAIEATAAEEIFVTHGQTAVFARYLNELGYDAKEIHTEYGNEEEIEDIKI